MALTYTDSEIQSFLQERKPLPQNWRNRLSHRPKRAHREGSIDCTGVNGNLFRLILRRSTVNPLDFSVILAVQVPQSNRLFRLRRCNGRSHQHTNSIEGDTFYDFHIHMATERYQQIGAREDSYAEATSEYSDFSGAVDCMVREAAFDIPPREQLRLV